MAAKPLPRPGVYKIVCLANGKVYVGSSLNCAKRCWGHRYLLNAGRHPNPHLQYAWAKYGAHAFSFEMVMEVGASELLAAEQTCIDNCAADNREVGFNIRREASSNAGIKMSTKVREALSISMRGRIVSAETRAKIGDAHRGKKISAEAKAKMSAAKLGKTHSAERRAVFSASVRARGPEWRAKLSAARIGNKNSLGRKQPPEVLAKIKAASVAMWAKRSPEVRAAAMKAGWVKRRQREANGVT